MQDEYLITNKLGSYSSSTFHLGNTRKYHGLLVVANSNIERKVIVNRLEEKISFDEKIEYLNTNIYKNNTVSPDGSKNLLSSSIDPELSLEYEVDGIKISKIIKLNKSSNQIEVIYYFRSDKDAKFSITPLITNRIFHNLTTHNFESNYNSFGENPHTIELSSSEALEITGSFDSHDPKRDVYYDFEYPVEKERGYDYRENLLSIGDFNFNIKPGESSINIVFKYKNSAHDNISDTKFGQPQQSLSSSPLFDPVLENKTDSDILEFKNFLQRRSKDFIVANSERKSIIAGYHWFEDWGRDTFISFRGILLTNNETEIAKSILFDWTKYIKDGLIPNRPGLNEYNSLDATLWYIVSIYYYWDHTKDSETVRQLLPQIANIIQELITGTKYGIKVLSNGLLISTDKTKGLTWMDAVLNDVPITPRLNAPVEIQMLWFNVLKIYKEFEEKINNISDNYYINLLIKNLKKTFEEVFWLKKYKYLADHFIDDQINIQIRPNPVIGLSLPFDIISKDKASKALGMIEYELLTPIGLRTLSPRHPLYIGDYSGSQEERDKAYHNGTVWPWLLGLYLKSYLKAHNYSQAAKKYTNSKLLDFWNETKKQKLNYIPEVFSGDSLKPNGCLSQAWNYATLLEVIYDLENN